MTAKLRRSSRAYRQLRLARNFMVSTCKRLSDVHPTTSVHPTSTVSRDFRAGPFGFVGRRCLIGPGVSIGRYTMLASEVAIVGDDHNISDPNLPIQFSGRPPQRRTEIGSDVWVGHGAVIIRGNKIGDGSVIAAGAVVTCDIPDRQIWGGVPAQFIRRRFEDEADQRRHQDMLAATSVEASFVEPQVVADG